jgi:hypothetical protein
MTIMFVLLASAAALELLVHTTGRQKKLRMVAATLTLAVSAFAIGAFVVIEPNVFSFVLLLLSLYRVFNMIRVVEGRMHEVYLRNATRTTSTTLISSQLAVAALWWAWEAWHVTGHLVWGLAGVVLAVVAALFFVSAAWNFRRTTWPVRHGSYSDKELPTVTVAVPARNEIEGLQLCLESIIASDYPKLEIIALDDRSITKRTPEIIRSFAHDGVRFIQGDDPAPTWLAKNQAYNRLADEASGEYILFCGADVRFSPHTIRTIITAMLDRNKQMMSILPGRTPGEYGRLSLVQAMRYWWELVPPRRIFNRPPVLSSCWVITGRALRKAGGFAAVARAIVPEAHFARVLTATDGYSFLRSSEGLGVVSAKDVADQRATAVRMRYPQLHRRPEQVAIVSLLELAFLVMPYTLSIAGFWVSIGTVAHVSAFVACILCILAYEIAVLSARVNTWWFGLLGQPFAALADIALLHYSMWKYEFSTVDWRGRNVTGPVMHVIPHLPPLKD